MKKLKLIFIAAFFIGSTSMITAQSRLAHIDTGALFNAMPEMKAAESQLEKLQKNYDTEIKSMMHEWETKVQQYDGESSMQTEEVNQERVEEVKLMQKNIEDYRKQALGILEKKQEELMKPILEKTKAAIKKVARAQGFQYVLDSSPGNGLILYDGFDLLTDVKKELGI